MTRLTLAEQTFHRIDDAAWKAATAGPDRAEEFCRAVAPLLGPDMAPAFCTWLDSHPRRPRQGNGGGRTQQGKGTGSCGCGGGSCRSAGLSRSERALVEALARAVIAGYAEPRPMALGYWPAGFVPPNAR